MAQKCWIEQLLTIELLIFLLVAVWPFLGLTVLHMVGRVGASKGKGILPPPGNFSETLTRMYLWPMVWWRVQRTRKQKDDSN
jgi:hypothetical protein